jgi:hypothetical protein
MNKPGAGSNQKLEVGDERESELTVFLKEIMAVARCNPHAGMAPYLAANAMHKYAVNIKDPQDRIDVMEFLEEVETMSGWPTALTREWLSMEWAWAT